MSSHRNGWDRGTVTVPAGEPALYATESPGAASVAPSPLAGRGPGRA
ncbi:hypothetical protein AB0N07_49185 [Streptomyces sp. NPDC051172]